MMDQFDTEVESLETDLANGDITLKEYSSSLRELEKDYSGAAQEAAQEAYDNEMDRW